MKPSFEQSWKPDKEQASFGMVLLSFAPNVERTLLLQSLLRQTNVWQLDKEQESFGMVLVLCRTRRDGVMLVAVRNKQPLKIEGASSRVVKFVRHRVMVEQPQLTWPLLLLQPHPRHVPPMHSCLPWFLPGHRRPRPPQHLRQEVPPHHHQHPHWFPGCAVPAKQSTRKVSHNMAATCSAVPRSAGLVCQHKSIACSMATTLGSVLLRKTRGILGRTLAATCGRTSSVRSLCCFPTRGMRRQGVIENVPQCVHVDFFIHQSRVRRVHFFWGTPPRFVQSTGKWTSFIRARIVVQEFGNVKVIDFGTSTRKQGNVAWIEIVLRHVHLLFIIVIVIVVVEYSASPQRECRPVPRQFRGHGPSLSVPVRACDD